MPRPGFASSRSLLQLPLAFRPALLTLAYCGRAFFAGLGCAAFAAAIIFRFAGEWWAATDRSLAEVDNLSAKELGLALASSDAEWASRAATGRLPTLGERSASPVAALYGAVARCGWTWRSGNSFVLARPVCGLQGFPRVISLVEVAPHVARSLAYASFLAQGSADELSALGERALPL